MMHPTRQPLTTMARSFMPMGRLGHLAMSLAMSGVCWVTGTEPTHAQGMADAPERLAQSPLTQLPKVEASPIEIPVELLVPSETVDEAEEPPALDDLGEPSADSTTEDGPMDSSSPSPSMASPPSTPRPRVTSARAASSGARSANGVRDWYQLNQGDRISVEVFDAPEYSGDHEIFSDGTVSLPLVGTFQLRGLTLAQAETLIANRLSSILRRPFTTVRLLEQRPLNLAVTGEVNEPGAYTLAMADVDGVPTVTKAIQLAQGIRLTADIRNIEIHRTNPYTNQVDEVFVADLWSLLEEGDLSQDIPLEDGDSIVIPEADELSYDEVNVLAYANISPDEMTVNVVGEVESPGSIQVQPNTPLHQAILAAGGFDINRAKKKEVLLIRLNPDGTVLNQEIEIDFEQGIDAATNPPLRPFDTIVVGRSNFTRVTDVLRQALSPVSQFFSILRIFGL